MTERPPERKHLEAGEPADDETARADLSIAAELVHPEGSGVPRGQIVKWIVLLAISGVSVYVIWPTLNEVFSATSRLSGLKPAWVVVALLLVYALLTPLFVAVTSRELLCANPEYSVAVTT